MVYYDFYSSPLGNVTLESDGENLTGLYIDGQRQVNNDYHKTAKRETLPIFSQTVKWLDEYFDGKTPDFTPEIKLVGMPFQKSVWEKLLTIPYGKTVTYGDIARQIAKEKGLPKMSSQAVGGAVGSNPVSIIVPCHRVIGANGNLTGYAGGVDKKIQLLSIEKIDVSKFSLPKKHNRPIFPT